MLNWKVTCPDVVIPYGEWHLPLPVFMCLVASIISLVYVCVCFCSMLASRSIVVGLTVLKWRFHAKKVPHIRVDIIYDWTTTSRPKVHLMDSPVWFLSLSSQIHLITIQSVNSIFSFSIWLWMNGGSLKTEDSWILTDVNATIEDSSNRGWNAQFVHRYIVSYGTWIIGSTIWNVNRKKNGSCCREKTPVLCVTERCQYWHWDQDCSWGKKSSAFLTGVQWVLHKRSVSGWFSSRCDDRSFYIVPTAKRYDWEYEFE